jgi:hypothetical protein
VADRTRASAAKAEAARPQASGLPPYDTGTLPGRVASNRFAVRSGLEKRELIYKSRSVGYW